MALEAETAVVSEAGPRHASNSTNKSARHPAMIGMSLRRGVLLVSTTDPNDKIPQGSASGV
jgi:hypothetical protein